MARLDDLQQLVKSLGEEVSNAVATLASTCMELQEHVSWRQPGCGSTAQC